MFWDMPNRLCGERRVVRAWEKRTDRQSLLALEEVPAIAKKESLGASRKTNL